MSRELRFLHCAEIEEEDATITTAATSDATALVEKRGGGAKQRRSTEGWELSACGSAMMLRIMSSKIEEEVFITRDKEGMRDQQTED